MFEINQQNLSDSEIEKLKEEMLKIYKKVYGAKVASLYDSTKLNNIEKLPNVPTKRTI